VDTLAVIVLLLVVGMDDGRHVAGPGQPIVDDADMAAGARGQGLKGL
jgi:hypothetical protein